MNENAHTRVRRRRIGVEALLAALLAVAMWFAWKPAELNEPGEAPETGTEGKGRVADFVRQQSTEVPKPTVMRPEPFTPEPTAPPPPAVPVVEEQATPKARFMGFVLDAEGRPVTTEVLLFSPDGQFTVTTSAGTFDHEVSVGTFQVTAQYRRGLVLERTAPVTVTFRAGQSTRQDFVLPIQPPAGTLGIDLALHSDYGEVVHVAPGSAAAAAGIQVGAVIIEVDGTPISRMDANQLQARLAPASGQTVALLLVVQTERGFEEFPLSLTARPLPR